MLGTFWLGTMWLGTLYLCLVLYDTVHMILCEYCYYCPCELCVCSYLYSSLRWHGHCIACLRKPRACPVSASAQCTWSELFSCPVPLFVPIFQCCGSVSESVEPLCFWASRIRIRIRLYLYGSGSFNQQGKKVRKTLILLIYDFFFNITSLKTSINVTSKSNKQENFEKYLFLAGFLSATDEIRIFSRIRQWYGSADPNPYQNVTDPQHYILVLARNVPVYLVLFGLVSLTFTSFSCPSLLTRLFSVLTLLFS